MSVFEIGLAQVVVALVALQRLGELALSARNTRRLLSEGAVEVAPGHYPLIVAVHVGWLVAIGLAVPADRLPSTPLLAAFILLQAMRGWVISSLGRFWTTRIVTLPGAPLVRRGPYRFMRHPNYAIVVAEIALLPLAFAAVWIAVIFSVLNAAVLAIRIRAEARALRPRREASSIPGPASSI